MIIAGYELTMCNLHIIFQQNAKTAHHFLIDVKKKELKPMISFLVDPIMYKSKLKF